jgi:hypothetical protein
MQVCGHIHEGYGVHSVPHPASQGGKGITLINSAVAYLFRGHPDAAPRLVELPSGKVLAPAVQQGRQLLLEEEQQQVWKAPVDVAF